MGMGTSPCAASGKWRNRRLKDVDRPSIGHSNCLSAPCRRGPRAGGGKIGHGDALGPSRQSFGALAGAVEGEAASRSTSQRRAAASKTLRTASSGCTVRIGFRREWLHGASARSSGQKRRRAREAPRASCVKRQPADVLPSQKSGSPSWDRTSDPRINSPWRKVANAAERRQNEAVEAAYFSTSSAVRSE